MDEFNNNGQQNNGANVYGQSSTPFNDQPSNMYGGQSQYVQYNPNMSQPQESKGLSIAAMVCGILSIIACWAGIWCWILGLAGIIMGAIGRKKGGKGMGTAGIVCGSVGIILGILLYTLILVGFSSLISEFI